MKHIDHEYTNEIVCPHCGEVFRDSWEFDDEGIYECWECHKPFSWVRTVTVEYSTEKETYRKCQRCGEDRVLKKVYNQSSKTNFKLACEECKRQLGREQWMEEKDN